MAGPLVVLAVITAAVGPAISYLPLTALRLVVGALLAIFGLQWLRKAVLRATGYKALHDEASAYLQGGRRGRGGRQGVKARRQRLVLLHPVLQGRAAGRLEVVFIVITFGDNQHDIGAAVIGAAAAIVVVTITGIAVRAPLTKVPENWMKFAVGIMLTASAPSGAPRARASPGRATTPPCSCSSRVMALVSAGCVFWLRSRKAAVGAPAPHRR